MGERRLVLTGFPAGTLVAAAPTMSVAGVDGADLGGTRARASTVFLLGMLACGVGARRDAFFGEGAQARSVAALSAAGVMTLVVGVTAIILGSQSYLTALMVGIWALWVGTTVRHLVTPKAVVDAVEPQPRELVKR